MVATAALVWEAEAMAVAAVAMKAATTAFSTVAVRTLMAAKAVATIGDTEAGLGAQPVVAASWIVVTAPVAVEVGATVST